MMLSMILKMHQMGIEKVFLLKFVATTWLFFRIKMTHWTDFFPNHKETVNQDYKFDIVLVSEFNLHQNRNIFNSIFHVIAWKYWKSRSKKIGDVLLKYWQKLPSTVDNISMNPSFGKKHIFFNFLGKYLSYR